MGAEVTRREAAQNERAARDRRDARPGQSSTSRADRARERPFPHESSGENA